MLSLPWHKSVLYLLSSFCKALVWNVARSRQIKQLSDFVRQCGVQMFSSTHHSVFHCCIFTFEILWSVLGWESPESSHCYIVRIIRSWYGSTPILWSLIFFFKHCNFLLHYVMIGRFFRLTAVKLLKRKIHPQPQSYHESFVFNPCQLFWIRVILWNVFLGAHIFSHPPLSIFTSVCNFLHFPECFFFFWSPHRRPMN